LTLSGHGQCGRLHPVADLRVAERSAVPTEAMSAVPVAAAAQASSDGWLMLGGLVLIAVALLAAVTVWRNHRSIDRDGRTRKPPERT
jgi:hypothetical protein